MSFALSALRAIKRMLPYRFKLGGGIIDCRASLLQLRALGFAPTSILDIGAYEGRWTRMAARIFPNASYLLFEGQRSQEEIIRKNLAGKTKYELFMQVLGDVEAQKKNYYEMGSGSSYYEEATTYPRRTTEIVTATLDSLLASTNLGDEVLMKLDTQGSELDILKGATKVVDKTGCILLETSLLEYNRGAPSLAEVIAYMDGKGFVPFDVLELHRRSYDQVLVQMDVLFMRATSPLLASLSNWSRGI